MLLYFYLFSSSIAFHLVENAGNHSNLLFGGKLKNSENHRMKKKWIHSRCYFGLHSLSVIIFHTQYFRLKAIGRKFWFKICKENDITICIPLQPSNTVCEIWTTFAILFPCSCFIIISYINIMYYIYFENMFKTLNSYMLHAGIYLFLT